jgi:hypothetical protein
LGYFQLGASINIDKKLKDLPPPYSIQFGIELSQDRRARESYYRLHFPEEVEFVQQIIRQEMLPTLRGVYARALNTTTKDIVFGDEFVSGMGLPSIGIMFPNVLWHWILNPHTDGKYLDGFVEQTRGMNCTQHLDVNALIMPLTVPTGAGLRYWEDEKVSHDVFMKWGKSVRLTLPLHMPFSRFRTLNGVGVRYE